jgi:hypothetical protein
MSGNNGNRGRVPYASGKRTPWQPGDEVAGFDPLWPEGGGVECQEVSARSISSNFVISVCVGRGAAQKYLFWS